MSARAWIGFGLMLAGLAACSPQRWATSAPETVEVGLSIANEGATPLRCTILFGHWVEQGIGTVMPGDRLDVVMRRQRSDGALFVPRDDGRRMMVENLICGPMTGWWERRADIALLPVRASGQTRFDVACRMGSRALCTDPAPR